MAQDPTMVRQFGLFLARELGTRAGRELEIRAEAWATLNGRASQLLVDPRRDLGSPQLTSFVLNGP